MLRENIQDLDEQDIAKISYGKIDEYTQGGKYCLVINTNSLDFMTFVNANPNMPFSNYRDFCRFKKILEFNDFKYTEKNEEEIRTTLKEKGYDIKNFTYASVFDSGRHGKWGLVKSDGEYYTVNGEPKKVQLSDVMTLESPLERFETNTLQSELNKLTSETTRTGFSELTENIRKLAREEQQRNNHEKEYEAEEENLDRDS